MPPQTVEVVVLEGCVPIEQPWFLRDALIDRDLLPENPEDLIFDEALEALAKTAVQKIRVAGAVRANSRLLPPGGVGYVGVMLPLPAGQGGGKLVVEDSASLRGPCSKITKATAPAMLKRYVNLGPSTVWQAVEKLAEYPTGSRTFQKEKEVVPSEATP